MEAITGQRHVWDEVHDQFSLDPDFVHLSLGALTPHPKVVQHAIKKYRDELDHNPWLSYLQKEMRNHAVLDAVAAYLRTTRNQIVLTESTTMGLAVVYSGLKIKRGEEILTTFHEHYAADKLFGYAAQRTGASVKKIALYEHPSEANEKEVVNRIVASITDNTRVVALTWVQSCYGVKLPLLEITVAIQKVNDSRKEENKIIVCADAVHGLGVEVFCSVDELGCDFFIAGCHKWLFGPRGTGLVWGSERAWDNVDPIITSFDQEAYLPWRKKEHEEDIVPKARSCNPGGFQAFEHRWALREAFLLHEKIGRKKIRDRIYSLAALCKTQLKQLSKVVLYTPFSPEMSSGLVCFDVRGVPPEIIVKKMLENKIIISQTPYRFSCLRITPSIYNTERDVLMACDTLDKIIESL